MVVPAGIGVPGQAEPLSGGWLKGFLWVVVTNRVNRPHLHPSFVRD